MVKQQQTYRKSTVWLCGALVVLLTAEAICAGGLLAGRAEAEVPPAVPFATQPEVTTGTTTESTTDTTTGATTAPTTSPVQAVGRLLWPCPDSKEIAASYGYRWGELHNGLDIRAEEGTPVVAAVGGVVTEVATGGYGQYVCIDHGGRLVTQYAHLSQTAVQVGDTVTVGQTIGAVGMSGKVTGPCLHFMVLVDGTPVDPVEWLS